MACSSSWVSGAGSGVDGAQAASGQFDLDGVILRWTGDIEMFSMDCFEGRKSMKARLFIVFLVGLILGGGMFFFVPPPEVAEAATEGERFVKCQFTYLDRVHTESAMGVLNTYCAYTTR